MGIADYIKTKLPELPNWFNLTLLRANVFGPWVYGSSYRKFFKELRAIDPEKYVIDMTNYAIEHVPYYRKRYGNLSIKSIEEFQQKIAFIDKNEVMQHWDDFCVDGIDWSKCIVGTTGGTSGKPLKIVQPQNRYVQSLAFWHKEMMAYGWNYHTRGVIRNHKLPPDRVYSINPILKEVIFDAFRMTASYAKDVYNTLRRMKVCYLHAYPSAAYQFLKYCYNQNLDLSFLKLCILTSEAVTSEQRYFIESQLRVPIYAMYGHSEKLVMAGTCPDCNSYHIEEQYGYWELVNEDNVLIQTEEIKGEIVGTTFYNYYFPLIRYKTGDYTSYKEVHCFDGASGRGVCEIIGHWTRSVIYRADGSETSTTALNLHGEVYEHIDGLQYIQKEKGELIVMIIPNALYSDQDESYLQKHFNDAMGVGARVVIQYVQNLIFGENGKFELLISHV